MIVGVFSDTHLTMPERRLKNLLASELGGAEVLIHAGDHASEEVADYLEYEEARPCYSVAGNMDPASFQRRYGAKRVFDLGGLTFGLIHGWGAGEGLERRVLAEFAPPPGVVVFGHSHVGLIKTIGGTLLVNPGSAWLPRGGSQGTVALITIEGGAASARLIGVEGG